MKKVLFILLLFPLISNAQLGAIAANRNPQRAINFYRATGITNDAQKASVNYIAKTLELNAIENRFLAIYPFVGGSATSHSYNLIDTATYKITWNGGMTHNSNGITSNGTSGYGNTGINTNVTGSQSNHLSIYSRTNTTGNIVDIGTAASGSAARHAIYGKDGISYAVSGNGALDSSFIYPSAGTNTTSKAFFLLSRNTSTLAYMMVNNSIYSQRFTINSANLQTNLNVFICAANTAGTPALYTTRNYAFASVGTGMQYSESFILAKAVEYAQSILGRQN